MTATKPILTAEQDTFLKASNFTTYQEKIELIGKAYLLKNSDPKKLSLDTEERCKAFVDAVLSGEWEVEVERIYINVTEPLGVPSFLKARREGAGYAIDDKGKIIWDIVPFEQADSFDEEQLEKLVPFSYRTRLFMLKATDARAKYGEQQFEQDVDNNIVLENPENGSEEVPDGEPPIAKEDDTETAIKIVRATMQAK